MNTLRLTWTGMPPTGPSPGEKIMKSNMISIHIDFEPLE